MSDAIALLEHVPSAEAGQCRLELNTEARSPHAVNRFLYGKFCEHLGSNIYNGMEAQILRNPTFGPWPFAGPGSNPDGGYAVQSGVEQPGKFVEHYAARERLPEPNALIDAYKGGCALWWFRLGPQDRVRFSPDVGPNGCRAQRVEVMGDSTDRPAGVAQWTHLPLHRTRRYQYRVLARAFKPAELSLSLSRADSGDKPAPPLAQAKLSVGRDWTTLHGRLEIPAEANAPADALYTVAVSAPSAANVVLARVLLYPDDHVSGADPDVIKMLKEAHLPLLRWPGGNFASGYHWRDGVGPVDSRPTVPNLAWAHLEYGLFGTDEFLAYCREVGCEPLICVNGGNGTPEEAAAWVQYCNGPADTPMGRLRAANGHPKPYGVRLWEIGNELYGRWQVQWTTPGGYADRYLRFAEAMRAADPNIRVLACGHSPGGEWDRKLITEAGKALSCITHHPLMGGTVDDSVNPKDLYHAFMALPRDLVAGYRRNVREMRDAGISSPRVAITELQLFAHYRPPKDAPARPYPLPTPATISEALYDALLIHECIRAGDCIEMLTHSATVNHGGGLRKTRERVWANPAHYGHVMGVALAGGTPVKVKLTCPTVSTGGPAGSLPPVKDMPILDAMAVQSADGNSLLLMLVHRSADHGPIKLEIDLGKFQAGAEAEVLTLAGAAMNDENTADDPERIAPRPSTLAVSESRAQITLPPYSLTRIRFAKR